MVPGDYRTFWYGEFILLLIFMIVLSNADISGLYSVQSLDCGVYHNYDTTTAVPSYTLLHTDAESCTQQHTVAYNYTQLHTAV